MGGYTIFGLSHGCWLGFNEKSFIECSELLRLNDEP